MVEVLKGVRVVEVAKADSLDTEVYVLECEGGLILIDVGFTPTCKDNIKAELDNMRKGWKDIKLILITHAHSDHIDNLVEVKELTGAEVMLGEGDIGSLKEQTGVEADMGLEDGDVIDACGGIEVIHVPGHSKGNLCFYLRRHRLIIAGDTIFGDRHRNLYAPPEKYCEDVELALKGIKKLLNYDFNKLLLSHGKSLMRGAKKRVEDLVAECA
jgi:glyoxylase-like metal-dependent hydrolase (beta-lactamase superfamily II)